MIFSSNYHGVEPSEAWEDGGRFTKIPKIVKCSATKRLQRSATQSSAELSEAWEDGGDFLKWERSAVDIICPLV